MWGVEWAKLGVTGSERRKEKCDAAEMRRHEEKGFVNLVVCQSIEPL